MEEELGVLGGGKMLPPRETAGGLWGLLLLVERFFARDEDETIGAQPWALFD